VAEPRGRLIVIAGPSGVGKGSVVRTILEQDPDRLRLSVSATTRQPRPAERDGIDYRFVTHEEFGRLIDEGRMLEWAEVFDELYGTPLEGIEEDRGRGLDVILEIDVQGAEEVRAKVPDALLILLRPPTIDELARRLRGRGTESEERIARRLSKAEWELAQAGWFDHVVVNDELVRAAGEVAAIIEGSRSG
jgi:guanylate kinase